MDFNAYAPPVARVAEVPVATATTTHYVVARTKFMVLWFVTCGMYQYAWFYQHWKHLSRVRRDEMWPVMRALFPYFFTFSLTEEIWHSLKRAHVEHRWSPRVISTVFVALTTVGALVLHLGRLEVVAWLVLVTGMLVLRGLLCWRVQLAANLACGDPSGTSNASMTGSNWLWLVLGALRWTAFIAVVAGAIVATRG